MENNRFRTIMGALSAIMILATIAVVVATHAKSDDQIRREAEASARRYGELMWPGETVRVQCWLPAHWATPSDCIITVGSRPARRIECEVAGPSGGGCRPDRYYESNPEIPR